MYFTLSNPLVHSSIAFRKSAALVAENYWSQSPGPFLRYFRLWSRITKIEKTTNIPSIGVKYRRDDKSLSLKQAIKLFKVALIITEMNINDVSSLINLRQKHIYPLKISGSGNENKGRIMLRQAFEITRTLLILICKFGYRYWQKGFSIKFYLRPLYWVLKNLNMNLNKKYRRNKNV
jgi:hypothetical protein